jgi:hypothetical protein
VVGGPGFDSRRYQMFWKVVRLERGPLNLVRTIEELLGINGSGSGLEIREYGSGDPLSWLCDTLYPQKMALTTPTSGRLVDLNRSRTQATEVRFSNRCTLYTRRQTDPSNPVQFGCFNVEISKRLNSIHLCVCSLYKILLMNPAVFVLRDPLIFV